MHNPRRYAQVTANHAPDVRLFMAMAMYSFAGYPMDLNFESGTAELWLYGYLSASEQSIITAVATESPLLGTMIGEVASDTWPEGADSLYTMLTSGWWIDSDSAAMVWNTTGMRNFLDSRPSASLLGFMLMLGESGSTEWGVVAADGGDTLSCSINAYTAEALACITSTWVDSPADAADFSLGQVYPNPVHSGQFAEIDITSSTAVPLEVEVYDTQGRLIGRVFDTPVSVGTRKVIIPADLTARPGVYIIQGRSMRGTATRKFVVTR